MGIPTVLNISYYVLLTKHLQNKNVRPIISNYFFIATTFFLKLNTKLIDKPKDISVWRFIQLWCNIILEVQLYNLDIMRWTVMSYYIYVKVWFVYIFSRGCADHIIIISLKSRRILSSNLFKLNTEVILYYRLYRFVSRSSTPNFLVWWSNITFYY